MEDNKDNVESQSKQKKKVSIKKYSDLEGKFLLVRVGTSEEPASSVQIKEVQEKIEKLLEDNNVNCLAFVTHHAVEIEIIEKPSVSGE